MKELDLQREGWRQEYLKGLYMYILLWGATVTKVEKQQIGNGYVVYAYHEKGGEKVFPIWPKGE